MDDFVPGDRELDVMGVSWQPMIMSSYTIVVTVTSLALACSLQAENLFAQRPVVAVPYPNNVYFGFQVTSTVAPLPGNPTPKYPDLLRSAQVEGEVLAQFVVDTLGVADMSTFKALKSTHDLFTASVRSAITSMRFRPAESNGRKVKQLVQMPFPFSLPNDAPSAGQPGNQGVAAASAQAPGSAPLISATPDASKNSNSAPMNGYVEFKITKAASPLPGTPAPKYPDGLRSANIEGVVLAQFVVDTTGFADTTSFKVLKSNHDLFTQAVRAVLPGIRFSPAEVDGRKVKQMLQMLFSFSLSKN